MMSSLRSKHVIRTRLSVQIMENRDVGAVCLCRESVESIISLIWGEFESGVSYAWRFVIWSP